MTKRKNFPLRISHDLYKELQRLADQEMRSVNGQIEFLLKQAIKRSSKDQEYSSNKPDSKDETDLAG